MADQREGQSLCRVQRAVGPRGCQSALSPPTVAARAVEGWKYSVRGKTVDGRELRIVATFVEEDGEQLLVVTAIDLDAER